MSDTTPPTHLYRRVLRRETHSPRSAPAIVVAVLLMLVAAWIGVESVLALLGLGPLLASPAGMLDTVAALPSTVLPGALVAAGAVVALVGLVLLLVAVTPGRRMRHRLGDARSALVVDDGVLAAELKHTSARVAGVDPSAVRATVGGRRALVTIRPASGLPIDAAAVTEEATTTLEALDARPRMRPTVRVLDRGSVGS